MYLLTTSKVMHFLLTTVGYFCANVPALINSVVIGGQPENRHTHTKWEGLNPGQATGHSALRGRVFPGDCTRQLLLAPIS